MENNHEKLQSGSLDKESSLEYYQGWIDNINESDVGDVDELVDFIHAFGIFSKYMVEHIEVDNDLMSVGYAGDATGRSVYGIMTYVFSEDVTISSDDLAIINNPNLNEIHFIYTYKNVLVTVDKNFVSDYDVFFLKK